ncbi:phytanoyl-CoA dioxygenase family protein [Pseudoxanthomonas sp. PXM04]|nr:phytanoyl-CoA dioxygenase family protein [Pseudoxanthomonas sp. PXM04]
MYPDADAAQIGFFREHGYLVVRQALPQPALDELESYCDILIAQKNELANDWAWSQGESRENRSFRIVQSSPSKVWADIAGQPYRRWLERFSSQLMGLDMAFWYDQFLGKPPGHGAVTEWHQDEG